MIEPGSVIRFVAVPESLSVPAVPWAMRPDGSAFSRTCAEVRARVAFSFFQKNLA